MSRIQRLRRQLIPNGSRLEAIIRSIYRKLRTVLHERSSSDIQQKTSETENLTKSGSPVSAGYQNHLGEIRFFTVDEVDTYLPDSRAEPPMPVNPLLNDQEKPAGRILDAMNARKNTLRNVLNYFSEGGSFLRVSAYCLCYQ